MQTFVFEDADFAKNGLFHREETGDGSMSHFGSVGLGVTSLGILSGEWWECR